MAIEIRELIIKARITSEGDARTQPPAQHQSGGGSSAEDVLRILRDRKER